MDKIFRIIGNYAFPVLTTIIGAALLFSAMDSGSPQPTEVKIGAACILAVGLISILFQLELISKPIRIALLVLSIGGAGYLYTQTTGSITSEMAAREEAKLVKDKTVQALKDVRSALEAYRVTNGRYTQDLDELTAFVKTGTVPKQMKIGAIPDSIPSEAAAYELGLIVKMPANMTAEQVEAQGLIVRDTVQISVMDDRFASDFAKKGRKYPFDIKNIKFAPVSGKPWSIQASMASMGGVQQPVVEVKDPSPHNGGKTLQIGSLKDAHLNGNWDDD